MTLSSLPFIIYSPGGNTTALIETAEALDFAKAANVVMKNNPSVEQVGFVMPSKLAGCDFHLEMMGGEFCGNASRCAALHWAQINKKTSPVFTVSGFSAPLTAHIQGGTVSTRIPGEFLKDFKAVSGGWLADFYGIRFFVTERAMEKNEIEGIVEKYKGDMLAMGVVILKTSSHGHSVVPWVWVKTTNTFIQETACASGSIAAAFTLRKQGLDLPSYSIIQPSGSVLSVGIEQQFQDITLSGIVEPMTRGMLESL